MLYACASFGLRCTTSLSEAMLAGVAACAESARPCARTAGARTSAGPARRGLRLAGKQALALHLLARELACPADRFRPFTRLFLGGFFVMTTKLHFAENALALHLFLERLEGLVDVVVADENLQKMSSF